MSAFRPSQALAVGLWMLVSAVAFSVLLAIVRHIASDIDVLVITFWRNVAAALIFIPWWLRQGAAGFRTDRWGLHGLRAVLAVIASTTIFYGAAAIPLEEATAISFASPIFATLLAILILREPVFRARMIGLAFGFLGILIMLRPGFETVHPAAWLVLVSAVSFACVVVSGKVLVRNESPALIVALLAILSVPLSLLPAIPVWQWPAPHHWIWLAALGLCANLNMYAYAQALRLGDASLTQSFDFVRLPIAAGLAYILFAETPDPMTWVGALVIFIATFYVTRAENRRSKR